MVSYRHKIIIFGLVVIMDFKKDFKDLLKKLRTEKGLTQKALADKIGIPVSMISKYEQGTNKPSNPYLYRICNFFEIEPSYFFTNFDEKTKDLFIDEFLKNRISLSDEVNDKNQILADLLDKLGFEIKFNNLNTEVTVSNDKLKFHSKYNTFKFIQILNMLENDVLINLKKYDEI